MKRNHAIKGIILALAVAAATPSIPAVTVEAAPKMTVSVKSPKKGVKMSGRKITVHGKKTIQLNVKAGGNVTKKATYKVSNKKVAAVAKNGKISVKKTGKAVITVKYKGQVKKFTVSSGNHNWKAHKTTKTVNTLSMKCVCGEIIPYEQKNCSYCKKYTECGKSGWCCCKQSAHTDKHIENDEPNNYSFITTSEKITYIDYYICACGEKKQAAK